MKAKIFIVAVLVMAISLPAGAGVLIGPGVNNGSFESPVVSGNWNRPAVTPGWNESPGMGYLMTTGYGPAPSHGSQTFQAFNNATTEPMWYSDPVTPDGALISLSVDFGRDDHSDDGVGSYWRGYIGQKVEVWEYNPATSTYGASPIITLISDNDTVPGSEPAMMDWITLSDNGAMVNPTWDLVVIGETGNLDGTIDWSSGAGCDRSYSHYIDNINLTSAALDPNILSVSPLARNVDENSGSTVFDVDNIGSGSGMTWTATESESWFSITGGSGTDYGQFTVNYDENSGSDPRSGDIIVTAPGATGSPKTVTLNQARTEPNIVNWLNNGRFNSWSAGAPNDWTASNADTFAYRPSYFGLYTLELEATSTSGSVSQDGSSSAGEAVLQLWWRNGGSGTGKVVVSGSTSGTVYDSGSVTLSTAWEPLNVSFDVVAETLTVTITINGSGNKLYVDDVWIGLNPNLVLNPGFEDWTSGSPDNWTVRSGTTVAQSTDSVDGTYSVQVGYDGQLPLVSQTVSVTPNTTYYFGYDRKLDNPIWKNDEYIIGSPSSTQYWYSYTRYGDTQWSRLGKDFTTNATDTSVTIQFFVGIDYGDYGYIDRVYIGKRPPMVGPGGGGTYNEDEQFYPAGWFSLMSNEPTSRIQVHVNEGANAVQANPADPTDYVNGCGTAGIKVILWGDPLDTTFNQWTSTKPQVMAYRYVDEPSTGGNTSTSEYQAGYDAFKAVDPDRLIGCSTSFADISAYPYDILFQQWYPIRDGDVEFEGFADTVGYLRKWRRNTIEWGKSGVFTLSQSFWRYPTSGPPYTWQEPTVAETAYLGIAPMVHGFNGVFWYSRSAWTTDDHSYYTTAPVLREMSTVAPAMLSPRQDDLVTCSDTGTHTSETETVWDVSWTLRKVPGTIDYVLLVVNDSSTDKTNVDFSVTLPSSDYPVGTWAKVTNGSIVYNVPDEIIDYNQVGSPAVLSWQDNLNKYAAKVYWITEGAPTWTDYAYDDILVDGELFNSYLDTFASDDIPYCVVWERISGGNPNNRYSYLEHKWPIEVTGGPFVTFYVEAYRDNNIEGDDMIFAYSTTGVNGTYTDMLTVNKNGDDDTAQSFELPAYTSGTVHIRVMDSDRTPGNTSRESIYVDHMYIVSGVGEGGGDPAGVTVTETGGSTDVDEEGPTSDTYTLVLDTAPTDTVTITVDPDIETDVGNGAGVTKDFTFLTSDWDTAQTVTVTAVDDAVFEGPHTSTITHSAASSDTDYNAISISNVIANVTDNDSCVSTEMHIEAMSCSEPSCGQGNKGARATVTIYDNCGDPVQNALVDGTFTGDFTDTVLNVATNSSGVAVIDSTDPCGKSLNWTFTVTDVTHGTLTYNSGDNVTDNCSR